MALSAETHFRLLAGLTVSQPLGADTDLGVPLPAQALARVSAISPAGILPGEVPSRLQGSTLVFHYGSAYGGQTVGSYRLG